MHSFLRLLSVLICMLADARVVGQGLMLEIDGKPEVIRQPLVVHSGYHELVFLFPESDGKTDYYQYRLSGLERNWKSSRYPIARYTNLPGADYRFEGRIIRGTKAISTFSVPFTISENFWEKWWFWPFLAFMTVLFLSIVIYFWFLYDFRQKLRVEEIRRRIAADLHDEVGANLSSITFLAALLNKKMPSKNDELELLLDKITRNSRESASLINDTIWALNPQFDSFDKLADKMKNFAAEFLPTRDIALTFENRAGGKPVTLSIDQRRNAYLIFKEIINNIVKHSEATKAEVLIHEIPDGLEIAVTDNGIGFDSLQSYAGNGLKNYGQRSRNGEISVEVSSKPGHGTRVAIRLWMKNHQN